MLWHHAFILTLLVELPVALLVTPAAHRRRLLPWILVANATSHPTLWAVWPTLHALLGEYYTTLLAGEALVYTYEALLYWTVLRSSRAALVSIAANTASMSLGLLISAWNG